MWLRDLGLRLSFIQLMVCLPTIYTNVPTYSDRYNRRPASQDPGSYGRGYMENRQLSFNRPGPNSFQDPRMVEQPPKRREYLIRSHETPSDRGQHKCRIWVPPDTVEKYPHASVIQADQANRLSLIEVCCTGYSASRLKGVTVCRAQCGCQNGGCRIPGECECYEGFVKNDNGDCVFACPLGCQNGQCFLDGSCQCDPGYKLDETRRFCRPICSSGCGLSPRHNCTEPEVCGCSKGYQLTDDGCQPVCEPDCGIGGLCKDNNQCECAPGLHTRDGVCQADCYQKCNNGVCVSRNRCICDPGFTYHEQSTMCVPV
ncbi:hypothetical protein KR084_000856 [Drosophila pseudotakahashii]|nr:hypothetical protein KR084_000856 [Drosophila pseudotakahashii]